MDKMCPWGYERRYVALHALHRYREATETLGKMITKMEESTDPGIRRKSLQHAYRKSGVDYVP